MSDSSSREAIMEATFRALATHGYADLTVQAIADEFDKSKSLILYHYDSKDALMAAFMEWLLEDFLERVERDQSDDPATRLRRMASIVVKGVDATDEESDDGNGTDGDGSDDGPNEFYTALLELRAQAPYNEPLRQQLVENDQRIREQIAADVREGIEAGQFREVDPDAFAAAFRSAIEGAQSHDVIMGAEAPSDDALEGITTHLIDDLLRDDPERPTGTDENGETEREPPLEGSH